MENTVGKKETKNSPPTVPTSNIMKNKVRRELPLFNFSCRCGEKLPTFASYKHHLYLHSVETDNEKPFRCDVCMQTFNDLLSLTLSPSTSNGLICCVCKNGLSSENHVVNEVHSEVLQPTELNCVQEHSAEKLIECDTLKRFCFEKDYNQHKSNHAGVHTGERPFKCEFCSRGFTRRYDMIQHERLHTGEKPFKCDLCSEEFTRKSDLRLHKIRHTERKALECDICLQKFHYENFIEHQREFSGLVCTLCQRHFKKERKRSFEFASLVPSKVMYYCNGQTNCQLKKKSSRDNGDAMATQEACIWHSKQDRPSPGIQRAKEKQRRPGDVACKMTQRRLDTPGDSWRD
ncbi:zinc finger protein 544-like [Physella acuta]|uniref:zinc finger protein 544-like n=1 Tax=Physella acuta TaxID=109671 RepID=UPI0027DE1716|nr:zinc finger protein 544-like [Physella acuta]